MNDTAKLVDEFLARGGKVTHCENSTRAFSKKQKRPQSFVNEIKSDREIGIHETW